MTEKDHQSAASEDSSKSTGADSEEDCNWEEGQKQQEAMERISNIRDRISILFHKLAVRLRADQLVDQFRMFAIEHPNLAVCVGAVGVVCAIPIFIFVIFAIISFFFTFLGLVLIEGTLLTIGIMVLGGVLIVGGFCTVSVVAFAAVVYAVYYRLLGILQNSLRQLQTYGTQQTRERPNSLLNKGNDGVIVFSHDKVRQGHHGHHQHSSALRM